MAMTESDIKIIIAAELKKAGFDKAKKATDSLDKTFKNLARTIGVTFSAAAIVNFGKKSAKAFADDEKAANRLTNTLKNMGLAFEDPRVKKFISDLEATSGVLDDKLRPAMQGLLTTTGSVTKSQQLLALAIDIAAQSGIDLETVASDLSKAYVGNTKGLAKYNLGLTKAELSAKSFSEIQDILTKQFSGANAAFLDTYAGKVALLNVAYANMQEIIGKSLVDAFARLAGKDGIQQATDAMAKFAQEIADVISGISILIDKLMQIPGLSLILKLLLQMKNFGILGVVGALGKDERTQPKPFGTPMTISGQSDLYTKQEDARKKADAAAAKRAKELAALQKKAELERQKREKQALQLKRAGTIFDMENIQIVAALQGQVDAEQRLRLVALLAINNDIADAAEKAATAVMALNAPALANLGVMIKASDKIEDVIGKIVVAQAKVALVDMGINNIPKAKNPFEMWDQILSKIILDLDTIANKIKTMPSVAASTSTSNGTTVKTVTGSGNATGSTVGSGGSFNSGGAGTGSTQVPGGVIIPDGTGGSVFIPTDMTNPNLYGAGKIPIGSVNPLVNANLYGAGKIPFDALTDEEKLAYALGLTSGSNANGGSFIAQSMDNPNLYGAGKIPYGAQGGVTVIVQGSVITEQDLASIVTDYQYGYQKAGQDIRVSSTAI